MPERPWTHLLGLLRASAVFSVVGTHALAAQEAAGPVDSSFRPGLERAQALQALGRSVTAIERKIGELERRVRTERDRSGLRWLERCCEALLVELRTEAAAIDTTLQQLEATIDGKPIGGDAPRLLAAMQKTARSLVHDVGVLPHAPDTSTARVTVKNLRNAARSLARRIAEAERCCALPDSS